MKKESTSKLEESEKKVREAIIRVNNDIDLLGIASEQMYKALVNIQSTFDVIRGVPTDKALIYADVKKRYESWKLQADKIQTEFEGIRTKNNAAAAAAGIAGAGIGALGPSAAMGVATTFGVASTGTAISSLNGIAATNAALAWLGGGTLAAGGGGMAVGNMLLSLAGPIGWSICIASITIGGFFYVNGKNKKARTEEIFELIAKRDVKKYSRAETEIKERIKAQLDETSQLVAANQQIKSFGTDYSKMTEEQQCKLGGYVNLMLCAIEHLVRPIFSLTPVVSINDVEVLINNIPKASLLNLKSQEKSLVSSLANFLHTIDLNSDDIKLIHSALKDSPNFLNSIEMTEKQFNIIYLNLARLINANKIGK